MLLKLWLLRIGRGLSPSGGQLMTLASLCLLPTSAQATSEAWLSRMPTLVESSSVVAYLGNRRGGATSAVQDTSQAHLATPLPVPSPKQMAPTAQQDSDTASDIAPIHASRSSATVTFVNPGIPGERFWDTVILTMQAAARDLNLELEVLHANRKHSSMRNLIEQTLERDTPPDYLVLVNDSNIATRMLPAIEASPCKVLMIIHGVEDSLRPAYGVPGSLYTSWIGSLLPDMESAARHTSRALIAGVRQQLAPPPYHGLALIGNNSSSGLKRMNQGMLEVLANAEGVVLDRVLEARWNAKDAERLTARYLRWLARQGKTPDLVWAGNTDMVIGAIKALKAVNLVAGEDVLLAGLNWSPNSIEMVEDGRLLLTSGGHAMAGAWAMVMLRDHADNASLPARQVIFPMSAITTNNVAIYGPSLKQPDYDLVDFASFTRPQGGNYRFNPLDVLEMMMLHQNHRRERTSDDTGYASSHQETQQ